MKQNIIAKTLSFPTDIYEQKRVITSFRTINPSRIYVLHQDTIKPAFKPVATEFKQKLHIIFQTLLESELGKFPLAVKSDGETAAASGSGSWFKMLCPNGVDKNGKTLLAHTQNLVLSCIKEIDPAGISIDFIRNFVFWEEVYEESRPQLEPTTCFCDTCIEKFEKICGIKLSAFKVSDTNTLSEYILTNHRELWEEFSVNSIYLFAKSLVEVAKREKPHIKVTLHLVPWKKDEFDGARRGVAGQDLIKLSTLVDTLSPMCYAPMLKRKPEWINELVQDIVSQVTNKTGKVKEVTPAIQICPMYGTQKLSTEEFIKTVNCSTKKPSAGVVIWPWEKLTEEQISCLEKFND